MAVNFGILSQGPSIGERFIQGQEAAEAASERNRLREMQMMQMDAQRENMLAQRSEREALAAERRRATEQQNLLTQYVRSGMPQGIEGLAQFGQAGFNIAKGLRDERMGMLDEERKKLEYATQRLAAATPETYLAIRADLGRISPQFANALPAEYSSEQIASIVRQGLALRDQLDLLKPMTVAPSTTVFNPRTGQAIYTAPPAPRESKLLTPEEEAQQARLRPPATPPVKPLTPAQEAARRDKVGKEYKGASAALQTTQDVLDSLTSVKESPGLPRITGLQSYIPSMPDSPAAVADVRLQNLRGKVTALGKAQAAATGAIGSIANQEWKILSDQIAAIDPSKGQKALLEQIDLIEQQAKGAMERIRDGYERTYGEDFARFPQFQNIPEPKTTRKPKPSTAPAAKPKAPSGAGRFDSMSNDELLRQLGVAPGDR